MGNALTRQMRVLVLAAAVAACAVFLAACGGSSSSSSASTSSGTATEAETSGQEASGGAGVDVGAGAPIPLSPEEIKLAFVSSGLSAPEQVSQKKGIEKVAAEHGVSVTVFDAEFNAARQFSIYQNVIDGGQFNALITVPLEGKQACQILSKTAPEKGIVVSIATLPICGTEFEPATGTGEWAPGTLDTVGYGNNTEGYEDWAKKCVQETGGGEGILINGQAGTPNYKLMTQVYEDAGLEIAADYATSYQTSEAVEKVSAALLAHPDLKVIVSQAPPLTQGIPQAIKAAGKQPGTDVKICSGDGGSEAMMNLVKAGELSVDEYVNNEWVAMAATDSIIEAAEGKTVPRVIVPGEEGKIIESGTEIWPPSYTKATVGEFQPTGS